MITQYILIQGPNHPPPPGGKGPGKWTPACAKKNPPDWCSEVNNMPIDKGVLTVLLLGVLLGIFILTKKVKR